MIISQMLLVKMLLTKGVLFENFRIAYSTQQENLAVNLFAWIELLKV